MERERSAGILLHPTSLPNGRLDDETYRFVDWLAAAGQSWWQVLPLQPGDETGSPYASPSAFAANPALLAEPDAPVIAEDLGVITEAVPRRRRELGFPGMLVLQFAFDGGRDNPYLPENHEEDAVV